MKEDTGITKLPVHNKRKGEMFLVPPPKGQCNHFRAQFEIDEQQGKCKCMGCGEEVSPMFVLNELMKQEGAWMRGLERYQDEMKRLKNRSRTKCTHCGEMTTISRK